MTVLLWFVLVSFSPGRGDTGLGPVLGSPTGVSFKYFLSTTRAIDAAAAWSFSDEWMVLHFDYLRHRFSDINVEKGQLPWYYGIGCWIADGKDLTIGGRFPVGLEYLFDSSSIDLFLEAAAEIEAIPETDFSVAAATGVRFFF